MLHCNLHSYLCAILNILKQIFCESIPPLDIARAPLKYIGQEASENKVKICLFFKFLVLEFVNLLKVRELSIL